MKPCLFQTLATICCFISLHAISQAQLSSNKITVDGMPVSFSKTEEQEPIFRGGEYRRYRYKLENGTAYYKSDSITTGDIIYYNRSYKNVPLLYDQVSDELATVNISDRAMIRLFNPMIKSFRIHGADFIYFTDPSNSVKQGFWEVLINTNTILYKREIKLIEEHVKESRIARYILPQVYYRVFKNGAYHDMHDKNQIPDLFPDKKQQVKAFLKKNRRKFRKAGFEAMLIATINHYDQIAAAQ